MLVNPAGLNDAEVRTTLARIASAITVQPQAMTTQDKRQKVQWETPQAHTWRTSLQDLRL